MEYAIEAIKLGSTAIGIQTDEGVILAVEKRITSPLMEPTSIEKVRQRGQVAELWIRIQWGPWGSGSKKGKVAQRNKKIVYKFHSWSALSIFLWVGGFSCSFDVLGKSKL